MRQPARNALTAIALLLLPRALPAQLADLQPGRNFTSSAQFGLDRSENIDPGDADNDGDLDVLVANGGDGSAQPNRIFINMGGLQGGVTGVFGEQTSARFAGIPVDTSRDCEFVDIEADGDLDIYISNRGTTANGGEPSRFYVNLGGSQAGTVGFYSEGSNTRWGSLASVPAGDQVLGGNIGPFRDYSCDCDFADLDDDGDSDLFHGSYGPSLDGTRDSRVFLNDGAGIFNEAWPWVNNGADIKVHDVDLDLADLDGDFDIDVMMSSRNSQARTYMNNLYQGVGASMFQDITQSALIATGATGTGTVNYESEYGDVDGDGDFDVWMKNYDGNTDRILRNDGFTPGTGYRFTEMASWIRNDPNVDENEVDFLDFDNDGDLDAFVANFGGTNWLYQSSLAQGLDPDAAGLFHRTGVAGGQAPQPELPSANNGGQTLDGDVADVDNDGDDDLLVANDANQQNYLFSNVLGVPDTHAPSFFRLTQQGDKPNGSSTVVHAQVRDNTSYYLTTYYTASLFYAVNGGTPVRVGMAHQGSMQYRGVIPAQADATVSWRVEVTDLAGNTGVSPSASFVQGNAAGAWTDIGFALGGSNGLPALAGTGSLAAGTPGAITLGGGKASSSALLFASLASTPAPFKGGTLAAFPFFATIGLATNASGAIALPWASWPAGLPSGTSLYFQIAIADPAGPAGAALSNALRGLTP
jgi:hypothetical protein